MISRIFNVDVKMINVKIKVSNINILLNFKELIKRDILKYDSKIEQFEPYLIAHHEIICGFNVNKII